MSEPAAEFDEACRAVTDAGCHESLNRLLRADPQRVLAGGRARLLLMEARGNANRNPDGAYRYTRAIRVLEDFIAHPEGWGATLE